MSVNLVNQYNILVEQARKLGLKQYRTTQRFRPASSGLEKIHQIEGDIRAARATQPEVAPSEGEATVIESAVEEVPQQEENTMAKTAKAKKTKAPKAPKAAKTGAVKRGRPPSNGVTIAAKTKEYNDLVPAAKKKGVTWAKEHTSFFGSHTAADAQLKRLQDAIKSA